MPHPPLLGLPCPPALVVLAADLAAMMAGSMRRLYSDSITSDGIDTGSMSGDQLDIGVGSHKERNVFSLSHYKDLAHGPTIHPPKAVRHSFR